MKNIKPEFINLEINNAPFGEKRKRTLSKTKTVDFEKENKENKILGELGEIIVLDEEINYLKQKGKHNLADKVKQISKENVSAGYDIISFEPDGHKKYIEVKSTNNSPSNKVNFLITSNEYDKGKELKNYYIYIVFNAESEKSKIWRLKAPFSFEGKGLSLTPIIYRVEISTIGTNELT